MKKLFIAMATLLGLSCSYSFNASHGFLTGITNTQPYLVRIETTDTKESITLKNGQVLSGDAIQEKSFMLSNIKALNLTIPWGGWDGAAQIYIDTFKMPNLNDQAILNKYFKGKRPNLDNASELESYFSDSKNFVMRNKLMERGGKDYCPGCGDFEIKIQNRPDAPEPNDPAYRECRYYDTHYTLGIDENGKAFISSKRVDRNPDDFDWCSPRLTEIKAPSMYVGTCWGGSLLKQKDACADWCAGSFDNVKQWACDGHKSMYCICREGITPGSHNIFNKIGDAATSAGEAVYKNVIKPAAEDIPKYGKLAGEVMGSMVQNWFKGRPHHDYCTFPKDKLPNPPTIDSAQAKDADTDGLLKYIEKYAPVAWIDGAEDYYPMLFSEYITAPTTSVIDQGANNKVVIPAGQITMQKLYDMYTEYQKDPKPFHIDGNTDNSRSHAMKIADCTVYGSNPNRFTDKDGNLTTPIYAITFEKDNKIYIQYLFFYGYNGPYDVGPLKGNVLELQDAHEGDLEHMTLELNKDTKALERIYYSSHGTTEGFWLDAHDPDVEYEGTHPVAYIAHYSHAIYPKEGTFVRIYGVANDITSQGQKWNPQVIRLYPESDKRFDPKTMGFMYFPGYYGEHGVGAVANQGWFMNPKGGDIGRSYADTKRFCDNPPHRSGVSNVLLPVDKIKYETCVLKYIPSAKPPE